MKYRDFEPGRRTGLVDQGKAEAQQFVREFEVALVPGRLVARTDATRERIDKNPRAVWTHDFGDLAQFLQTREDSRRAIVQIGKMIDIAAEPFLRDPERWRLGKTRGIHFLQESKPASITLLGFAI